jgi:hypothetical protein
MLSGSVSTETSQWYMHDSEQQIAKYHFSINSWSWFSSARSAQMWHHSWWPRVQHSRSLPASNHSAVCSQAYTGCCIQNEKISTQLDLERAKEIAAPGSWPKNGARDRRVGRGPPLPNRLLISHPASSLANKSGQLAWVASSHALSDPSNLQHVITAIRANTQTILEHIVC